MTYIGRPTLVSSSVVWNGSSFINDYNNATNNSPPDNAGLSSLSIIRKEFAAGAGGSPDDITIYSSNAPFKFRVVDTHVLISTTIALATIQLRDATAGAGNVLSDAFVATAVGRFRDTALGISNVTKTINANGTLIIRRSDNGIAGEVLIFIRKE